MLSPSLNYGTHRWRTGHSWIFLDGNKKYQSWMICHMSLRIFVIGRRHHHEPLHPCVLAPLVLPVRFLGYLPCNLRKPCQRPRSSHAWVCRNGRGVFLLFFWWDREEYSSPVCLRQPVRHHDHASVKNYLHHCGACNLKYLMVVWCARRRSFQW